MSKYTHALLFRYKLILVSALSLLTTVISAQTPVTIGSGTGSSTSYPVYTFYNNSASESIYLGSEINTTGNITKLAYYKSSGASTTTPAVKIYMKNTALTTVGTSSYTLGTTNFNAYTLVYDGTLPNGSSSGWMEVTLQTPFSFSSTSNNLSILILGSTYISSGRPSYQYTTQSSVRRTAYYYSDPTAWSASSSMSPVWERPNLRLTVGAAANCSTVTVPSSVNTTASKTTICNSESLTFNLASAMPAGTGFTYQWKSSADGISYSDAGVASATSSASLTASASAKYFKCDILCNGSTVLTSNPIQITIQLAITGTTPASRCGTGTLNLQATTAVGNTLKWYDQASNGTLLGTGNTFTTPSISGNTTYYVGATGGGSDVHLGALSPSIGTLASTNNGEYTIFNVTNSIQLKSLNIYPLDAGTSSVQLLNSSGTVLQQTSVTVSAGEANSTGSSIGTPKTVTLNWTIPAGTGYRLRWDNPGGYAVNRVLRNTSGAASYYNTTTEGVTITGNSGVGTTYWFYFYDLVFSTSCGEGTRVPVTASVNPAVTGITASSTYTVAGAPIQFASQPNGATSYAWSGPNSYIANTQNPTIASAALTDNGTYTVTVTNSYNCSATANTTVTLLPSDYVWTGTIDNNWYNTGNWNVSIVPNDTTANVTIPGTLASGNYPEIATSATVRNISVESNARITIDGTLNVKSSWIGGSTNAAIVLGNGKVVLNGTTAQSIDGNTQLQTLLLNNTAGALLASNATVEVFKAAELQKGTLNTSNGTLRFRSTSATECAIINNFGPGYTGTLSGNIEAERYYAAPSANSFNQHYMGSPVDAPSVAQFGASGSAGYVNSHANCYVDVMVSGSAYGTFYEYDETHGNQCGIESWKVVTAGTAQNGKGYSVAKTGSGVLTLSGNANLNTSYTVGGLGNAGWSNQISYQTVGSTTPFTVNSGWHLISNPYLASLNIGNHAANNAFDAQIQVWQTTGAYAGSYQPLTAGVNAQIAPFQAFMVHKTATGGSTSYTLYASDRSANSNTFYRQANTYELKLVAENIGNGLLDQTTVAFNSDATMQFDPMYDANKVQGGNSRHTLRTVINDVKYAINTLGDLTQTSTVPVHMRPGLGGTFKFIAEGIHTFDPTSYIYLEDKVTGEWVDLRQQAAYTFTMNVNDAEDRFVLHFTPAAEMNTVDATCDMQGTINIAQAGMANWNYTLTNTNGANIATGTLNETTPITMTAPKGTYTLTLIDANNYTVTSTLTIGGAEPAQANFTVSANTVEENENVILTAASANASYIWDLGNGATATGSGVTMVYTQAGVYTVTLQTTNSYGCTATFTQLITVNEAIQTGIAGAEKGNIAIWSYGNTVTIQLATNATGANAEFYNAVGQLLHTATLSNTVYSKSFGNISSGYVIVKVKSDNSTSIKKVTINN